ncbi:MAG: carboxypeptidase-like regulatory domain-containing protein, partial [Bacteroidales bacterium]
QTRNADTLMLTIGDPADFGRHNRAELTGRILDGATGETLPGAVIYSENTGSGSSTDNSGEFSVTLPVGELQIRLSYVGYEDQTIKVNLLGSGSHDFYLFEETHRIDEVTIMARRAEANISRTRMSVISMDSRVLKELQGSIGEQDIIRSMTLLPGVQSVGEFGSGFNVRGGRSDQNLIMLENVPLFNSSHLFGLISTVNPDMVSEMTLYKGGIPSKFGERISSVMDIGMNPGNVSETKLTGGIGLISSRLHLETPLVKDRVNLSIAGRSSYSNRILDRIPAEELMNSAAGFYDFSSLLSVSPNQNNNFSLFAYYSDDSFSFGGNTEYDYSNTLTSLKWNRVIGEKFSFNISGGLSMYDYNVKETEQSAPAGAYNMNSSIDYSSVKGSLLWFPDGNHRVEIGFNAIHYGIAPGNLDPLGTSSEIEASRIDPETGLEISFFLGDDFEVSEKLSIEAGIRYTDYQYLGPATINIYDDNYPKRTEYIIETGSYGKNEKAAGYSGLEPRLNVRYSINEMSSVKASYTRHNQYISVVSNTAVITPSDIWKLSDTHLRPLSSDNFALGYFRNFRNNSIETSAELYYKNISNIIEYRDGASLVMNRNIETELINAEGYNWGIELYAGKNSGRFTGWASYTYSASMIRSNNHFPEDQINRNNWFASNFDKPHELILNTGYNISRRWRVGGSFTYSTGRPVTLPELRFPHGDRDLVFYSDRNKYRLPDYHRLDIYITRNETLKINKRRTGNWTVSLLNLYGRKNPYSVFYEKAPKGPRVRSDSFNLYKLYIIGRPLPTVTYNFRF